MVQFFMNFFKSVIKVIKSLFKALLVFILVTAIGATILVCSLGDNHFSYDFKDLWADNVTQLNSVRVAKEIAPTSVEEIVEAIRTTSGPISIGGGRFSQGGQIAFPDSLHIDMRRFNKVLDLNIAQKKITVQPGIRWRDIQEVIDPHNLSIRIMQTYSNFTVGGSLSVNVHGRYVGEGPLVKSVEKIKLVLADGSVIDASPSQNSELFYAAIGGYGGIGVIVEATLNLADNEKVERQSASMAITEYQQYFFKNIRNNKSAVFTNGDIYPPNYKQVRSVTWYKSDAELTDIQRLRPKEDQYYWQPKILDFMADYDFGKWLREYALDPLLYTKHPVVWRNNEASYDLRELEPASRKENTYGLREYFIPVEKFDEFIPKMRSIFQQHHADILNVSIRHANQDPGTLLAWARNEVFAFVVYYRQGTSRAAQAEVKQWSRAMIDAAVSLGGSYYLPYQIFETKEQFIAAYPNANRYFEIKKSVDPNFRFRNQLWDHLYPDNSQFDKEKIAQYFRGEEQTFLTIPEWYLVFNPGEYAEYLKSKKDPSNFPFWESIEEYWKLYDRSRTLAARYPENSEYLTMLRVIGISTTVEYAYKGLYEKSIGNFSGWTANHEYTQEDEIIADAQLAYSRLIYDQAWYKFSFLPWVHRIWKEPTFFGHNFIRKLERKLFLTAEFSFKAFYASAIEYAAKNTYEQSDGFIYLTASLKQPPGNAETFAQAISPAKIMEEHSGNYLLAVPRWGEFTKTIPRLLDLGFQVNDISGNNRLVISALAAKEKASDNIKNANLLFASALASDETLNRFYFYTNVKNLADCLQELKDKGYKMEHLYDY